MGIQAYVDDINSSWAAFYSVEFRKPYWCWTGHKVITGRYAVAAHHLWIEDKSDASLIALAGFIRDYHERRINLIRVHTEWDLDAAAKRLKEWAGPFGAKVIRHPKHRNISLIGVPVNGPLFGAFLEITRNIGWAFRETAGYRNRHDPLNYNFILTMVLDGCSKWPCDE